MICDNCNREFQDGCIVAVTDSGKIYHYLPPEERARAYLEGVDCEGFIRKYVPGVEIGFLGVYYQNGIWDFRREDVAFRHRNGKLGIEIVEHLDVIVNRDSFPHPRLIFQSNNFS